MKNNKEILQKLDEIKDILKKRPRAFNNEVWRSTTDKNGVVTVRGDFYTNEHFYIVL